MPPLFLLSRHIISLLHPPRTIPQASSKRLCLCLCPFPPIPRPPPNTLHPLATRRPPLYPSLMRSRSTPRKLEGQDALYNAALHALMRRAHSIHEMKEYLSRRAEDKEIIGAVIARLREHNYLDDAKFAREYARRHAQSRRQGRYRIARELRARGVPDAHIEAALDSVFAETNEAESVRVRIRRKLAHARGPLDDRKLASLYRSLLAAGFSSDIIRSEIKAAIRAEASELPDAESPE